MIILSLLTYFQRPDFNLPLFVFVLILWEDTVIKQKTRLWSLIFVSLIVDLIWIIYWATTWNYYNLDEQRLNEWTLAISIIEFVVKIIITIITFVKEEECKKAITEIGSNIKSIFKGPA
jgi:hypothetical protein